MHDRPTEFEMGLIRGVAQVTKSSSTSGSHPGSTQFIKLNRALSKAAVILGVWSESLERWLNDEEEEWADAIDGFYEQCLQVVRAGVFLEGQGNYGGVYLDAESLDHDEERGPAHPRFLECRLTGRGRQLLDEGRGGGSLERCSRGS